MNETADMLNRMYKNVKIGEETMGTLFKTTESTRLKQDILFQMEGYTELEGKVRRRLKQNGKTPEKVGKMETMMIRNGLKMNTAKDHSTTKLAEMLIQGSTMGIIQTKETLSRYPTAEEDTRQLAEEIVRFEQENIERLKKYL